MDKWLGLRNIKRKTDDSDKHEEKDPQQSSTSNIPEKKRKTVCRKYDESYLAFGFTWNGNEMEPQPHCVICCELLSNQSMKPSLLKRHFESKHANLKDKTIEYFKTKLVYLKDRKQLMGGFVSTNEKSLEASYRISLRIAKNGNVHTIGETLILPAAKDIVSILFDSKMASKLDNIPLSNDTVRRRISEMADSAKEILIQRIKQSQYFALQLDESTDIANFAQLLVFIRFEVEEEIAEEYLFCDPLPERTTGDEIFNTLNNFMLDNSIPWSKCIGVCSDGARALTGKNSGAFSKIKAVAHQAQFTHCSIHREALVTKAIPERLKTVLDQSVKVVNFIKTRALNSRIFGILCQEMGSEHETLLLHSEVRWLSRGKILRRLFELKSEVQVYLCDSNFELKMCFFDKLWLSRLAYLADIFGKLNELNLSLQGPNVNLFIVKDKITATIKKLELVIKEQDKKEYSFLPLLESFIEENNLNITEELVLDIKDHCCSLINKFNTYFPENYNNENWIRNPLTLNIPENLTPKEKEQLIEISSDRALMEDFKNSTLINFWIRRKADFREISDKAIKFLMPFCTSYLCEKGFSTMLFLKNKYRSRLVLEPNLRLKLSNIEPDIKKLCFAKQAQGSH